MEIQCFRYTDPETLGSSKPLTSLSFFFPFRGGMGSEKERGGEAKKVTSPKKHLFRCFFAHNFSFLTFWVISDVARSSHILKEEWRKIAKNKLVQNEASQRIKRWA
eukprot:Sro412_g137881.2  (106) ;mRNA; f:36406-36723